MEPGAEDWNETDGSMGELVSGSMTESQLLLEPGWA